MRKMKQMTLKKDEANLQLSKRDAKLILAISFKEFQISHPISNWMSFSCVRCKRFIMIHNIDSFPVETRLIL